MTGLTDQVRSALESGTCEGNHLVLEQMTPKEYAAVRKVVEKAGGKWDRRKAAIVFHRPAAEVIAQLLTGEVTTIMPESPAEFIGRILLPALEANDLVSTVDDDVFESSAGGHIIEITMADGSAWQVAVNGRRAR